MKFSRCEFLKFARGVKDALVEALSVRHHREGGNAEAQATPFRSTNVLAREYISLGLAQFAAAS
jgi:hypothetical protein